MESHRFTIDGVIMKISHLNISLLLFLVFSMQKANGQELKSLALENNNPSIQSETVLLINVTPSDPNFCGMRIEWGDGEGQDFRYEKAISEPIKFTKKYVRPGDYTVSVKGKYLSRGLKSAVACKGKNLTLPIKVVDSEQIRKSNEVDRANELLKIEAAKRQELELRLRAEQLKLQEAQLKQQEALIKQREEDTLRQKIQAEERAKIQAELEASKLKEELAKRSAAENRKKSEPATPVQPTSPTPPKPTGF